MPGATLNMHLPRASHQVELTAAPSTCPKGSERTVGAGGSATVWRDACMWHATGNDEAVGKRFLVRFTGVGVVCFGNERREGEC